MDAAASSNALQVGVGGILALMLLDKVFTFLKGWREKEDNANDKALLKCEHGEIADGGTLIALPYMRRFVESLDQNTKAIRELLEHEQEEMRILNRVEKQLDRFDQQ